MYVIANLKIIIKSMNTPSLINLQNMSFSFFLGG